MRRTYVSLALLTVVLLVCTGLALAQAPLQGTVTLQGGKTLTGEIKVVQVGVVPGSGIGTLLPDDGSFKLKVDDQVQEIKAADLAEVDIAWGLMNPQDLQSWAIKQISIIKRDGTRVTGQPSWGLQASSAVVGDLSPLYAFPKGEGFVADNLVTKVEIAGAMPSVIQPPAPTVPPPTVPPPTVPPAAVPPATPPPAAVPPATTPPAATPPAATPPPAPVETPPAAILPPPMPVETVPAPVTPPASAIPAPTVVPLGGGAYEITVTAPKSGEKITIRIQVEVLPAG